MTCACIILYCHRPGPENSVRSNTLPAASFDLPQANLYEGNEPPSYYQAISTENLYVQEHDTEPPAYNSIYASTI